MACENCRKEVKDEKRLSITVQISAKDDDTITLYYCQACWSKFWNEYVRVTDKQRDTMNAALRATAKEKQDRIAKEKLNGK